MITPIIEKIIPQKQIEKICEEHKLPLPLPEENPMEEAAEVNLGGDEMSALLPVLEMTGRAPVRLHVTYHLQMINAPLISVCMCENRIFGLVYKKEGVQFTELTGAEDVRRMIESSALMLPSPVDGETRTLDTGYATTEQAVEAIENGTLKQDALLKAMEDRALLIFWLNENGRYTHALAVDMGSETCSVVEQDGRALLVCGSADPVTANVYEKTLGAMNRLMQRA